MGFDAKDLWDMMSSLDTAFGNDGKFLQPSAAATALAQQPQISEEDCPNKSVQDVGYPLTMAGLGVTSTVSFVSGATSAERNRPEKKKIQNEKGNEK